MDNTKAMARSTPSHLCSPTHLPAHPPLGSRRRSPPAAGPPCCARCSRAGRARGSAAGAAPRGAECTCGGGQLAIRLASALRCANLHARTRQQGLGQRHAHAAGPLANYPSAGLPPIHSLRLPQSRKLGVHMKTSGKKRGRRRGRRRQAGRPLGAAPEVALRGHGEHAPREDHCLGHPLHLALLPQAALGHRLPAAHAVGEDLAERGRGEGKGWAVQMQEAGVLKLFGGRHASMHLACEESAPYQALAATATAHPLRQPAMLPGAARCFRPVSTRCQPSAPVHTGRNALESSP